MTGELVDLLKEEIKKIASEENINVSKLNEYTHIYERLKLHEVTSVQELEGNMQSMSYHFVGSDIMTPAPHMPRGSRMGGPVMGPRNDLNGILDIFKEAVHAQKPKVDEISSYMSWIYFLNGTKDDLMGLECDTDEILENIDKLVLDITKKTVEMMRKRFEDNITGKPYDNTDSTVSVVH